jgi:hypothetical protein
MIDWEMVPEMKMKSKRESSGWDLVILQGKTRLDMIEQLVGY